MSAASLRAAIANGFGLRLRNRGLKAAYVVVYFAVPFAIAEGLRATGVATIPSAVVAQTLGLLLLLFGARVFRGPDEDVDPPRLWWRMTATSRVSASLGVLAAVSFLGLVAVLVVDLATRDGGAAADVSSAVEYGLIAYLYLTSAVRLDRRERLAGPPPAPPVLLPPDAPVVDVPGPTVRVLVSESKPTDAGAGAEPGLLRPSADGRRIEVFHGGLRIGELARLAPEHRDALAGVGAVVRVRLLRTGDLLWADVPTLE
ncbi:hypothetical protein [Frondihabitans australicus]|uniref:Uncharacterized protein n=1 Tax=Frondihabitans australicus TaxID=386892 RepID=A0A495IGI7_9MICO|nr:hypothetical protein [Frondihabitans australicus]RKR75107.1 hypothetical protein C8E83_2244 [Frondihabitans australicus]